MLAHDAPPADIPDLGRGKLRPLIINDGFHFADFADYYSAAVMLALYADEVAVEYRFANNRYDFGEMLEYLLMLQPLAEHGMVRFFAPNTSMHDVTNFESEWRQLTDNVTLEESEWRQLDATIAEFGAPNGIRLSPESVCWGVTSQLAAKSATPQKFSLLARSNPEGVLLNALANMFKRFQLDGRGYTMSPRSVRVRVGVLWDIRGIASRSPSRVCCVFADRHRRAAANRDRL